MKKALGRISGVTVMCGIIGYVLMAGSIGRAYDFEVISCISDIVAMKAAKTAGLNMTEEYGLKTEDMRMQIVYQLARRSVVKVVVKDAAGSGIVWKTDNGIVIVSSRHLLMKDVEASVVFCNGETAQAQVMGYSQQYDIGFLEISENAATDIILRDIYEAVPVFYETESEQAKTAFAQEYAGAQVLQIGAQTDEKAVNFSVGSIKGLAFVPLFNTNVLETECFSKAGMSGGGVFDETGRFVGMISGGDVPEESEQKEAELTYSIPPMLIEAEYNDVVNR